MRYVAILLALGLFACSGENGNDGARGPDGTHGGDGTPGAAGSAGAAGDAGAEGPRGAAGDAASCPPIKTYTVFAEDLKPQGELASTAAFCQPKDHAMGVACRTSAPGDITFQGTGFLTDVNGNEGFWCSGIVATAGTHVVKIEVRCLGGSP